LRRRSEIRVTLHYKVWRPIVVRPQPAPSPTMPTPEPPDIWSEWLLNRRQAGDAALGKAVHAAVQHYVDRVLDGARLTPGMTLLDVGTGEGSVAFRAIERIGPSLKVIMTDVSAAMLRHAEHAARAHKIAGQCRFHLGPADDLQGIADGSVDVVTTRAVLAYVADKPAALKEFFRVLKPGGRISLAEPVLQDEAFYARALRRRVEDTSRPADRFLTLVHRWKAAQFPDTEEACAASPLANYSERDLLNMVCGAHFTNVHLEFHIDVAPSLITSWDTFLGSSPHPWAPSLRQIMAEHFSADDARYFEDMVRSAVESGNHLTTDRTVYVVASKPG